VWFCQQLVDSSPVRQNRVSGQLTWNRDGSGSLYAHWSGTNVLTLALDEPCFWRQPLGSGSLAVLIHEAAHAMNMHHGYEFRLELERLAGVAACVMFLRGGDRCHPCPTALAPALHPAAEPAPAGGVDRLVDDDAKGHLQAVEPAAAGARARERDRRLPQRHRSSPVRPIPRRSTGPDPRAAHRPAGAGRRRWPCPAGQRAGSCPRHGKAGAANGPQGHWMPSRPITPRPAIPTRWRSCCRNGRCNTTGICATGCSAGGTASASNPRSNYSICT
jgi:hypothetical protein